MAETAGPSDLKPERIDTYKNWQAEQKIPVVRGFFVEDVNTRRARTLGFERRALFDGRARRHRRHQ